jgi:predicted MPP superfamily phosphohydrolase
MIEPERLVRKDYQIRLKGIPEDIDAKKIIFLSDIHAGPNYNEKRLIKLKEAIASLSPDLILFGGDLVAEQSPVRDQAFRDVLIRFFIELKAIAPVIAVYGNHDIESDINKKLIDDVYRESGVQLLVNSQADFEGLLIYGLDDGFHGEPKPPAPDFSGIVLAHQPDLVETFLKPENEILVLSGHTHRGQVTWFGRPIVTVPLGKKYRYGKFKVKDGLCLIVSGGIGTVHLPLRLGAPPEILTIEISGGGGGTR